MDAFIGLQKPRMRGLGSQLRFGSLVPGSFLDGTALGPGN